MEAKGILILFNKRYFENCRSIWKNVLIVVNSRKQSWKSVLILLNLDELIITLEVNGGKQNLIVIALKTIRV